MSSSTPSASSVASSSSPPSQYRSVGIVLAIGSGVLIGTSFVFKKKGLLRSQAGHAAGEGVAYLKSVMWWTGMIMMICGELCNFGAYAFVEAIVVTPLGALSVVISAILSHLLLKEKLTLFGWIGCTQCILGAILIALNAPSEQSVSTIKDFKHLFLAPGFLTYGGVCIVTALVIIFYFAPKYGKKSMLWYISVCSLIGGISVSCTQGLGACIVTSIRGENQFKNWFIYFLLFFVICTLLTEIFYLNVALALYNTAMVTPTYYVMFTFCTLVTSVILYQGLKASASQILTIALAFLVICTGIFILQMSRVDPRKLSKLDRRTTILLQAARSEVKPQTVGPDGELMDITDDEMDEEKKIEATEEPGMDAVAGRFGAIGGTVVRARRRATIQGAANRRRPRRGRADTNTSAQTDHSTGMDSVQARDLHAQWRAERGMSTNGAATNGAANGIPNGGPNPTSNGHAIDGLPLTSSKAQQQPQTPNGNADADGRLSPQSQRFLSSEQLNTSPLGTPASEQHRLQSVHFQDQGARARTTSGRSMGNSPALPPAALVATSNSSIPSMNLPPPVPPLPVQRTNTDANTKTDNQSNAQQEKS